MILGIDHIAIAVKDISNSLKLWRDDLNLKFEGYETIPDQKVKIASLSSGKKRKDKIELLQSLAKGSSIEKFIKKKGGGGIHHIAFIVNDIQKEMRRLTAKGYRLVYTKPKCGWRHSKITFLHPKSCSGVLIELVEAQVKES